MKRLIKKYILTKISTYGIDWVTDVKRCWLPNNKCCIIDVGANVGNATIRLANEFPTCTIHAFEPIKSTRLTLQNAVCKLPNVTVYAKALGDFDCVKVMTAKENAQTNRIVQVNKEEIANFEQVEVTTLDQFLDEIGNPKVGLLKIDTEGFDINVLNGSKRVLALGLIDLVVVECTFNPRGASHVDVIDLIRMMRQFKYEVIAVYSSNVGAFIRGSGYSDILFALPKAP